MEIRRTTISFSKGKAQAIRRHEAEIKQQLDKLDKIICNSQNLDNIDGILKQYDDLKKELQHQYENKCPPHSMASANHILQSMQYLILSKQY